MVVAMKKNIFVIVMMFWSCCVLLSQETWIKTYGGRGLDNATSITTTPDGGYVFTGGTNSFDGDFKALNMGDIDIFVIKLDSYGDVQWKKTFGGSRDDQVRSITTTPDGGFVLTGGAFSNDGDFKGMNKGGDDIFVIKIDEQGDVQWKKTFGGSNRDWGQSITTTPDGGYVLTGSTNSYDGDFKGVSKGGYDIIIIKLDTRGDVEWTKTLGGNNIDWGISIIATLDGDYVLTGGTSSNDSDFKGMNKGALDIFVIKIDSRGDIHWKNVLGGSDSDVGQSITTTPDGGFVLTGGAFSNDGDFKGMNKGGDDIFVIKIDEQGDVQWKKTFGGKREDGGGSITTTPGGGYVLTGVTNSNDGDLVGTNRDERDTNVIIFRAAMNIIIIRLDSRGDVQWKKVFGGNRIEGGYSINTSPDGGYVITGGTSSNDGDFKGMNKGGDDIFVIKIDSNGNLQPKSKE
jgi:hypothetical protein